MLRRAVSFDVAAWGQVDPATLLSTGCLVLGAPADAAREREVFSLEHDDAEVNRLVDLVHRVPPAGSLVLDTDGTPERSPRYARLLQPLGIHDDLRVAFVQDGLCWASLYAYRRRSEFTAGEAGLLGALAGDLADGVRLTLLRDDAEAAATPQAPGLVLLAPDGSLSALTDIAERWLHLLSPDGGVPPVVTSLVASLQSAAPGL